MEVWITCMRQLVSWNLYVFYGLYLSNENGPTSYKLCPTPIVEFVFGVKVITIGCSKSTATIYNNLVVYRQHFLWFELVSTPSQTEEKGQIFSVSMTLLITPLILYPFFYHLSTHWHAWVTNEKGISSCHIFLTLLKVALHFNPGFTWSIVLPEKSSYPSFDMIL